MAPNIRTILVGPVKADISKRLADEMERYVTSDFLGDRPSQPAETKGHAV